MKMHRALCLCAAAAMLSGCGYALAGRGNSLPAHIKAIGVPQFTNQSRVPDLDRVLTDQVRIELQGRGQYRTLPDSTGVDAVLTAVIQQVTVAPVNFTVSRQASRYLVTMTASIEFKLMKDNKVHWANPSFRVSEEYDVPTQIDSNDPSAIFRTDANALDRLAKNFARSVVTSILEAF